jgi:aromatic-amino-acid transaminase
MFETLKPQPADKILALVQKFKEDPRPQKIDLGVGVYKNAEGVTPVMRAVKAAEHQLWQDETTKAYVGLTGDPAFSDGMIKMILGDAVPRGAVAAAATPGGTGAVRQAFELARLANRDVRVFVSNPTWPNHVSMLRYLGIEMVPYRYFDEATCGVDFEGMTADLAQAKAGDVVLLHGCCHNPTGANLNTAQWQLVVDLLAKSGATPMIDIAYQGFGDGLEEDAAATRLIAASLPETIIAASCSKKLWYLPRADGSVAGDLSGCFKTLGNPRHIGLSQPAEFFFSTGSWCALGHNRAQ